MKILGIDPGSRKVGYALLEISNGKRVYLNSEALDLSHLKDFFERIALIHQYTKKIVQSWDPDEIALEALIFVKSPSALIKLAQARGVILAAILTEMKYQKKVFEYSPNLVKVVATGYGHATKLGVQNFIQHLIGKKEFKSDDESDALAVAFCHSYEMNKTMNIPSVKGKKNKLGDMLYQIKQQQN